jgi:hypothetical protein
MAPLMLSTMAVFVSPPVAENADQPPAASTVSQSRRKNIEFRRGRIILPGVGAVIPHLLLLGLSFLYFIR